jgi:hypothetical protein
MSRRTAVVAAVAAVLAAALGTALVVRRRRTGALLPQQVRRRVPESEPRDHLEEDVTGRPTPRSVTALSTPPHVEQSPEAAVED